MMSTEVYGKNIHGKPDKINPYNALFYERLSFWCPIEPYQRH